MAFRMSWVSVVCTGTRLWSVQSGVQISAGAENFFLQNVETGSGGHTAFYVMGTGIPSWG